MAQSDGSGSGPIFIGVYHGKWGLTPLLPQAAKETATNIGDPVALNYMEDPRDYGQAAATRITQKSCTPQSS
jgi:hypothetical protein